MVDRIDFQYGDASTSPGDKYAPVTKSDSVDLPDGPCRTLLVDADGTANLVEKDGTVRANYPLQKGYNPIVVKRVNTGGTATGIWAIY
jgi:hypothetical protein